MGRNIGRRGRQSLRVITVAVRRVGGHEVHAPLDVTIQAGDETGVVLGRPQSVKALGERVAA